MAALIHTASGHIVALGEGFNANYLPEDQSVISQPLVTQDEYWDGEQFLARETAAITSDKVQVEPEEEIAFTLPDPCWIKVNNDIQFVEGGSFIWSSETPGAIVVQTVGRYSSNTLVVRTIALVDLEAKLHAKIDKEAGAFRLNFITDAPGQSDTYRVKEGEARSWTSEADPADFPFLSVEAAATGVSIDTLAATIVGLANAWIMVGSAIEGARIGAKRAVTNASTAEAKAAASIVNWSGLLG